MIAVALFFQGSIKVSIGGTRAQVKGTSVTANQSPTLVPTLNVPPPNGQPTVDVTAIKAISANGILGRSDAPIKITVFIDYACPYCAAAAGKNPTMIANLQSRTPGWEAPIPGIIKDYVNSGKVQLIFREYIIHGPAAAKAAEAAQCAGESSKYWEMAQALYDNTASWQGDTNPTEKLIGYAQSLDLDITSCLRTGKHAADVNRDTADGRKAGVGGTPTFFVNEQILVGAQPYSEIKKVIESKLPQ